MKTKQNGTKDQSERSAASSHYHIPVLLAEVLEGLNIKPDGAYVDCTFGGGGHSKAILEKLNDKGRLVVFDQDEDARDNVPADERLLFVPQNFRYVKRFLQLHGYVKTDGLLADLGVSSHQFDKAERGFSTRFDAELDMRMDQRQELTAAVVLQSYAEKDLHKMFEQYGEVTNSKTLAKTIVDNRRSLSLRTTKDLKNALAGIVKGNPNKYFAQVFQALRIEVNDEMGALKELLLQLPDVIKPGGRAAIITFHSIEDKLVKTFFREGSFEQQEDHPFENTKSRSVFKPVNKKPIEATAAEQKLNPRSRSAKLRVAERL
jgi:16S rRNA (cytosine1402-N4)-methyltransferase